MTKAEVIAEITKSVQCDEQIIAEIIARLLSAITVAVVEDKDVFINGFGTFYAKLRNETTGRDIARNKLVSIPARYIPHFRPYRDFINQVRLANLC